MAKAKNIHSRRRQKPRRTGAEKLILVNAAALTGIFLFMLIAIMGYTVRNLRDAKESSGRIDELEGYVAGDDGREWVSEAAPVSRVTSQGEEIQEEPAPVYTVQSKYRMLHSLNPDMAGWLTIEGTDINFPVMQKAGDNDYYLSHNFDNEEDKRGLLVLDYRCDEKTAAQNYLIHGHNMRSGGMFGELKNYREPSYYKTHKYINFNTIYEDCRYEVFAVCVAQVLDAGEDGFRYYDCLDMGDESSYRYFVENVDKIKLYDTDVSTEFGDTFVMLSTCEYSKENGRLVVVAKRVKDTQ